MSRDVEGLLGMGDARSDAAITAANDAHMHGYEEGRLSIFAFHPEWTVSGMCKPDCLPCQRLNELVNERESGYSEAINAALQRVQALADPTQWRPLPRKTARISDVIAAIKGDQP